MTRHLQRPYRIWPLDDLDKGDLNEATLKFSTMNLQSSLSVSKCNNPLPAPVIVKDMTKSSSSQTKHKPTSSSSDPEDSTTTTQVALQQVINTTELLEQILSHLPSAPLYHLRNVSGHWTSLIEASPTLRRDLWLTASGPAVLPRHRTPHTLTTEFEVNPILTSLNIFNQMRTEAQSYHMFYLLSLHFPPRWRTKGAFWRGMQITSPPAKRLFLRSSWLEKYVECEGGITAGMLADLLEFQTGALYLFHS